MTDYTERQVQILNAAIEIIAFKGVQNLTISTLASNIGISDAALYRHFKNKVMIIYSILDYFFQQKQNFYDKLMKSEKNTLEMFESIFQYYFETFTHQPALAAVIFSEGIFQNDPSLADKILEIMNFTRSIFLEILNKSKNENTLCHDISSQHLAMILMGSLRLIVNQWYLSKHHFNLQEEGNALWNSIKILITKLEI